MDTQIAKLIEFRSQARHAEDFVSNRFEHSRIRFKERYGLDITYDEWEKLNYAIFRDERSISKWVDIGDSVQTGLYHVKVNGTNALVAYSETAYVIMTVMPRFDLRLQTFLQHNYHPRATTDADLAYREHRRDLSRGFDTMTRDQNGLLVLGRVELPPAQPIAEPNLPFASALRGFVPTPPAPPAPKVVTIDHKPVGDDVTGMFSRLNTLVSDRKEAFGSTMEGVEAKIAALEAQIVAMRDTAKRDQLATRFLDSAAMMADSAFEQFREGLIDAPTASKIAQGLFLQLGEEDKPSDASAPPTRPVLSVTKVPAGAADGVAKRLLTPEERSQAMKRAWQTRKASLAS